MKDENSSVNRFISKTFSELSGSINLNGDFDESCILTLSFLLYEKVKTGSAVINIKKMGGNNLVSNVNIKIRDFSGAITISIASEGTIDIGACGQLFMDIRLGLRGALEIGEGCTCNGARIVAVNASITLGADCMLSDEVLIQGSDQHGIINLDDMEIINKDYAEVKVAEHVWLGRRATLTPNINVDKGSIVGACSVVTKDVSKFSLVVGSPARVIKENVSWSRPWQFIDEKTKGFLAENGHDS